MLELEHLSKTYRTGTFGGKALHAVSDVCLTVGEAEVVSLIGESGSGKSTIGKMILRLIPISSGSIRFYGMDVTSLKGEALKDYYRKVQGVFQDPFSSYNPIFKADRLFRILQDEFYPEMTRLEWDDRVARSLKDVGLNPPEVLNKFPHQLSGGQLQRFLIARALLLDIKFLMADEIISMLDASRRIDVLNLLSDLKQRGLSILFITHDLSLANYISERAVILYRGHVVEIGDTGKIFDNPQHPYTQMLMASVPRLDSKWKQDEIGFKGSQLEIGQGCVYYGRCPLAQADCTQAQPVLVDIEPAHQAACIHLSGS